MIQYDQALVPTLFTTTFTSYFALTKLNTELLKHRCTLSCSVNVPSLPAADPGSPRGGEMRLALLDPPMTYTCGNLFWICKVKAPFLNLTLTIEAPFLVTHGQRFCETSDHTF